MLILKNQKNMLEFSPKTNVKEGVSKFINWYLDYSEQG